MNAILLLLLSLALAFAFGMVRYAPTRPERLPLQKIRAAILDFLKRRPGASITEICRETGIAWGTAQHHLYLLRRAGLAASAPSGRTHRFFLPHIDERAQRVFGVLHNPGAQRLARRVVESPGLRQKDLCEQLGFTRKVFREHVNLLKDAGLVAEIMRPRVRLYVPLDGLRPLLANLGVSAQAPHQGASPTTEAPPFPSAS